MAAVLAQEEHAARMRGAYASDLVGPAGGLAWPNAGNEDASLFIASDASPKGQGPQATWRSGSVHGSSFVTSLGPSLTPLMSVV